MSHENVERMRIAVGAVNRGDRAAFLAQCDPELENIPPRHWPESEPLTTREAVWDFFVEANGLWEQTDFEVVEVVEAGDDRIAVDLRQEVQGKASGVPVGWAYWLALTFRDGRGIRMEWFADRAEALQAVGLAQ